MVSSNLPSPEYYNSEIEKEQRILANESVYQGIKPGIRASKSNDWWFSVEYKSDGKIGYLNRFSAVKFLGRNDQKASWFDSNADLVAKIKRVQERLCHSKGSSNFSKKLGEAPSISKLAPPSHNQHGISRVSPQEQSLSKINAARAEVLAQPVLPPPVIDMKLEKQHAATKKGIEDLLVKLRIPDPLMTRGEWESIRRSVEVALAKFEESSPAEVGDYRVQLEHIKNERLIKETLQDFLIQYSTPERFNIDPESISKLEKWISIGERFNSSEGSELPALIEKVKALKDLIIDLKGKLSELHEMTSLRLEKPRNPEAFLIFSATVNKLLEDINKLFAENSPLKNTKAHAFLKTFYTSYLKENVMVGLFQIYIVTLIHQFSKVTNRKDFQEACDEIDRYLKMEIPGQSALNVILKAEIVKLTSQYNQVKKDSDIHLKELEKNGRNFVESEKEKKRWQSLQNSGEIGKIMMTEATTLRKTEEILTRKIVTYLMLRGDERKSEIGVVLATDLKRALKHPKLNEAVKTKLRNLIEQFVKAEAVGLEGMDDNRLVERNNLITINRVLTSVLQNI